MNSAWQKLQWWSHAISAHYVALNLKDTAYIIYSSLGCYYKIMYIIVGCSGNIPGERGNGAALASLTRVRRQASVYTMTMICTSKVRRPRYPPPPPSHAHRVVEVAHKFAKASRSRSITGLLNRVRPI